MFKNSKNGHKLSTCYLLSINNYFDMKRLLLIALILNALTVNAQQYSSQISDSSIMDFMNWFLKSDNRKSEKYIAQKMQILMPYNFEYKSTTDYASPFGNIFAHNKSLFQLFTKKDADFFVKQIQDQKDYYWKFRINGIKLLDAYKESFPKDQPDYFYSLPLFSCDKSMVIISVGYINKNSHTGGVYYLFKKNGNAWKKIKEFQKWEN